MAPLAVTPPFLLVRRLGSAAGLSGLADLPLPLFRRLLGRLEARPLQTVALLRVCFFLRRAPFFNNVFVPPFCSQCPSFCTARR